MRMGDEGSISAADETQMSAHRIDAALAWKIF